MAPPPEGSGAWRILFGTACAFQASQLRTDRLGYVHPHGVIMLLDGLHDLAVLVEQHRATFRAFSGQLDDQRIGIEPVARSIAAVDDRAYAAAENDVAE